MNRKYSRNQNKSGKGTLNRLNTRSLDLATDENQTFVNEFERCSNKKKRARRAEIYTDEQSTK